MQDLMQQLSIVGVEDGALVLGSDDGQRYRVDVDEGTLARLRRPTRPAEAGDRRVPPKEIQAHIRAGMSAQDVADVTGVPLEHVLRFEGPVLAERDHVLDRALRVRVHTAADLDPTEGEDFGTVIRSRLADSGAREERWTAWKDADTGWVVELAFTSGGSEHAARWSFDPRTHALAPLTAEAISLSQQGETPPGLIPRLRAVPFADGERSERGSARRFDSAAFVAPDRGGDTGGIGGGNGPSRPGSAPSRTGELPSVPLTQTADLLEALRRRRGERDGAAFEGGEHAHPSARSASESPRVSTIHLVDIPLEGMALSEDSTEGADEGTHPGSPNAPMDSGRDSGRSAAQSTHAAVGARGGRKGRTAMPSWDEIVFGARSDDT